MVWAPLRYTEDNTLTVIVTSCFGHGEPPQNAEKFYNWTKDDQRKVDSVDLFKHVKYCVFGLGQSKHYPERYQAVGKFFDSRLEALGAQRASRVIACFGKAVAATTLP